MAAQDLSEKILPKEPLDLPASKASLPKEPLDLPPAQTGSFQTNQAGPASQSTSNPQYQEVKALLSWSAPGRPFRKRGKQYYLTSLLIVLLLEIILFLFSQYLLMAVVLSLVFVAFALATIPPKDFHYRVSTEGITIEDHFFLWQELYDFYFKKREGIDALHIRTHVFIPGELTITLGNIDREHVKKVLLPYLPYREVIRQTFMEKSGDWLAKNFPMEKVSSEK